MLRGRWHFWPAIVGALIVLGGTAGSAEASSIAFERLYDTQPYDVFVRDLERTRSSQGTGSSTESSDAAILGQNGALTNFGLLNNADVSYTHDLSWVLPSVSSFLSATLTIDAFGVVGSNDVVHLTDTVTLLGPLNNGSAQSLLFSTTIFNNASLVTALTDNLGLLHVFIDKNEGTRLGNGLNALSVFSSRLDVEYEAAPVPEPASLLLLGTGLAAGARAKLRRRATPADRRSA